jgi:phosphoribosylformimino-5-aminoimidazole carboxamide ribotide isomerase
MEVIPAIDLMRGKVVRLSQGDPKTAKSYDYMGDPMTIAKKWKNEGANILHIIDLDSAFNMGNNSVIISQIADAISLPIQVGGGIRKLETAENLLKMGIRRIILGALAFSDQRTLTILQKKFGDDRIMVALDHQDGKIMVEAWKTFTNLGIEEALAKFLDLKVKTFLVTSIVKDGTLRGPDINTLRKICAYSEANVIAAGGVSSLNDLIMVKKVGASGVVIGKALYEGAFTLKEALNVVKEG